MKHAPCTGGPLPVTGRKPAWEGSMASASQAQAFVRESEKLSQDALENVSRIQKEAARAAGNGLWSGAEAARDFHFKLAEIVGSNVMAS
jgi:hypothetical protein